MPTETTEYEFHPYANLFPLDNDGPDWEAFVEDVNANGIQVPILIYEGKILDGRRRYLAAKSRGNPIVTQRYDRKDGLHLSLSLNLRRRHLTPAQCAAILVQHTELFEAEEREAAGRRREGNVKGGKTAGRGRTKDSLSATLPATKPSARVRDRIAEAAGVSPRTAQKVVNVRESGDTETLDKIARGELTPHQAEKIVREKAGRGETADPDAARRRTLAAVVALWWDSADLTTNVDGVDYTITVGETPKKRVRGRRADGEREHGLRIGQEAINLFHLISQNDPHRARAFRLVADWLEHNKPK